MLDVRYRMGGPPGPDRVRRRSRPRGGVRRPGHRPRRAAGRGRPAPAAGGRRSSRRRCGGPASATAARSWCTTTGRAGPPRGPGGCCASTATPTCGCSTAAGRPGWRRAADVETGEATPAPGDFTARPGGMPVVEADGVPRRRRAGRRPRPGAVPRRDVEPVDPVAGHIPGAVNVPTTANLGADGRFRSAEELRDAYAAVGATAGARRGGVLRLRRDRHPRRARDGGGRGDRRALPGQLERLDHRPEPAGGARLNDSAAHPRLKGSIGHEPHVFCGLLAVGDQTATPGALPVHALEDLGEHDLLGLAGAALASPLAAAESGNTW